MHGWVQNHPAFENVVHKQYWMPLGNSSPALGDPIQEQLVKNLMASCTSAFMKSGRPLLISGGLSEDFVIELEADVESEMRSGKTGYYACFQTVYARKKQNPPPY
jgi:hypothetical protein